MTAALLLSLLLWGTSPLRSQEPVEMVIEGVGNGKADSQWLELAAHFPLKKGETLHVT